MVQTDSEPSAKRMAARLADPRAAHFYDPERFIGTMLMEDHFQRRLGQAVAALPTASPLRERLAWAANAPAKEHPLWDAVLIFRPGVEWHERPPSPDWWAQQVEFFGADTRNGVTGVIWKNHFDRPPTETDWFIELREAMRMMAREEPQ